MADTQTTNDQSQLPTPAPELKRLDFLVGKWRLEGQKKEGPVGSAGPIEGWQSYEWMKGRFFLVHRWGEAANDLGVGVEYIGYDAPRKRFHTHFFDNQGPYTEDGSTYEGEFRGDTFVLCGPARVSYTPSADGKTVKFTVELPKDLVSKGLDAPDSEWMDWMEATFTKVDE